jgi:drug/metabolite transporter (DMT)-like permease
MKAKLMAVSAGIIWGAGTIALKAALTTLSPFTAAVFLSCGVAGFALFQGGLKFGNATQTNALLTAPLILVPLVYGLMVSGETLSVNETAGIICLAAGTALIILRQGRETIVGI